MEHSVARLVFDGNPERPSSRPIASATSGFPLFHGSADADTQLAPWHYYFLRCGKKGLPYVELTTDITNIASQSVILANGGKVVEQFNGAILC